MKPIDNTEESVVVADHDSESGIALSEALSKQGFSTTQTGTGPEA